MQSFLTRHEGKVKGVLNGFDRVRFRGTLRLLANVSGLRRWLSYRSVLLKDFKVLAMELTDTIKQTTQQLADDAGRPLIYLRSSSTRKEGLAREIATSDGVTSGLVCVLTCVEPCLTFKVGPNRQTKHLELRSFLGKCLHHYFYLIDRRVGWLNLRLQTWFPFNVHVVLNGREWLAQQLIQREIAFEQRDNCFVHVDDLRAAQTLLFQQLRTRWPRLLDGLVRRVHPAHRVLFGQEHPLNYYWSADETEWASDVLFHSAEDLGAVYPRLVQHAVTNLSTPDVLRFLGKRPHVQKFTTAQILSHLGTRHEGVRVKHTLNRNSVKMYDKQHSVLRVETTINNTRQMKVYRAAETVPSGPKGWRILRKGVADLKRRAEISQKVNERYLEAMASVDAEPTLAEHAQMICQRTLWKGRPVRPLNPLADADSRLLQAVNRGEFAIQGFRNRDLCEHLFDHNDPRTPKQRMAKVTRLIRLLRGHGLVNKVPKTHRYVLSKRGRDGITALLAARGANIRQLIQLAA